MARTNTLAQSFVSQGLITKFADIKVARDSVDPRQWDCSMSVQPTYSVNWISIKIGVGLL